MEFDGRIRVAAGEVGIELPIELEVSADRRERSRVIGKAKHQVEVDIDRGAEVEIELQAGQIRERHPAIGNVDVEEAVEFWTVPQGPRGLHREEAEPASQHVGQRDGKIDAEIATGRKLQEEAIFLAEAEAEMKLGRQDNGDGIAGREAKHRNAEIGIEGREWDILLDRQVEQNLVRVRDAREVLEHAVDEDLNVTGGGQEAGVVQRLLHGVPQVIDELRYQGGRVAEYVLQGLNDVIANVIHEPAGVGERVADQWQLRQQRQPEQVAADQIAERGQAEVHALEEQVEAVEQRQILDQGKNVGRREVRKLDVGEDRARRADVERVRDGDGEPRVADEIRCGRE